MKWALLLLIPMIARAGFSDIPESERYQYKKSKPKEVKQGRAKPRASNNSLDMAMRDIVEGDKNIASLLERQEKNIIVRRSDEKIMALTRVKGILLNSVLAMNVKPSKFIVRLKTDGELENAEIRCLGYSFEKRVPAQCDLMVLDGQEFKVDVDIWDLDGAEGIIADYYYSGEEKTFLTSSFASFLQGVLDVAKDRITTPFGEVERNNAKNKVLGGLVGVAGNVRDKVAESGEKNLTISYVNSGKEVLAFFNQTINLSKEEER